MKRTIILAIAAIVLATGASAQKKIEFGVKAGMNSAQEFAEDGNTNSRIGLHAGIFAEFFISNRFGLQPELQYSMQGGGGDKLDYVNLPIILKIYVLKRDLSVDAGVQPGYMLSAKGTVNGHTVDAYDVIDNKLDVAIAVGASYKFAERFHAGLRYNIGTIKFIDGIDRRNGVIQLFVGVRF
ncbi:MAG: PorT family protein [Prevotellaceae bacterium]|jgi:hypothetical protein|nr:PorT family protein [Prevotellaceae bacterium]